MPHRYTSFRMPWEVGAAWSALACIVLAGCVASQGPGTSRPASTEPGAKARSSAVADSEPPSPKLLFDAVKWQRKSGSDPEVVRETTVTIDVKAIETQDVLRIQLPGTSFLLQTIERTKRPNGTLVWLASVNKSKYETATFAIVRGILTGSIAAPNGRAYRIRYFKGELYLLQEIDRSKFPPEACLIRAPMPQVAQAIQSSPCTPEDAGDTIDVMVVYTNGALAEVNPKVGTTAMATMEGAIENAFSQANTSYAHSGIKQRLLPVYPYTPIQYTEGASTTDDLDNLKNVNNPQLSSIHVKRKALAADIVVLVTAYSGSCGLADVMTTVSPAFASNAFAIVPYRCLTDSYSFAHELGHLMGARHDIYQDATRNSPFAFNHGYAQAVPTGAAAHPWYTVMGTNNLCSAMLLTDCQRIDFWSTPDTQFDYYGDATGVANEADNQQTLNTSAKTVANFMCSSSRTQ